MTAPAQLPEITEIDGRKVIATAWAKLPIVTHSNTTPTWVTSEKVVECLLEDEQTVYVDLYFAAGTCDRWFNTSKSVATHMRVHGTTAQLKKTVRELQQLKDRAERIKRNRQEGAKKAAITRNAQASHDVDDVVTIAAMKQRLHKLEHGVKDVLTSLIAVGEELQSVINDVDKLRPTTVDPEVAEKAKRYDALKGLMKD